MFHSSTCLDLQLFFEGHSTFKTDEFIGLIMHFDPHHHTEAEAIVEIFGIESGVRRVVTATVEFGPPDEEKRMTEDTLISADFENPGGKEHKNQVTNISETTTLPFTLHTNTLKRLAKL
jgi:hypothetical protein